MIVRDVVREVAALLNDDEEEFEFTHWTESDLVEYANDAALQITQWRAGEFSKPHTIDLVAGARQTLPSDGIAFYRVAGTIDRYGRTIGQPSATDTAATRIAANWFEQLACRRLTGDYAVRSFASDADDQTAFYVDPPVPPGKKIQAVVLYASVPVRAEAGDVLLVPAIYHNAVIEWMLYRAYGKDTESATDAMRSTEHHTTFNNMMAGAQQLYDRYTKQVTNYGKSR
ncbi:phage adaptor protein [Burkholderia metallica]|uniref:phage adaptor protein n=1 Tax=Burkholderia metallica TaxID=488729 RepID=UPI00299D22B7|nr:DUF6682 family protein [Burkholderia metallica]